jgi:hypothetical protein
MEDNGIVDTAVGVGCCDTITNVESINFLSGTCNFMVEHFDQVSYVPPALKLSKFSYQVNAN